MKKKIDTFKLNTVYIGDSNVDILCSSQPAQKFTSLMSNNNFVSLVNTATRINEISSTCVDHIFVKFRNSDIFKSAVFDVNITDHCVLGLTLNTSNNKHDKCISKNKVS